ncbi:MULTISPECIES: hypothetical protein [Microbulbifer]|nr:MULTISPECIES: hypothetical protein [Microbulbifer]
MKTRRKKSRKSPRQMERSVRQFWTWVFLVGLAAVLLMYIAMA